MIGIDTNILLRHLTADDPVQSPVARRIIDERSVENPIFISLITLVETCWTLRSAYRFNRDQLLDIIGVLISTDDLVIEHSSLVSAALDRARDLNCDFPDALIALSGQRAHCETTATFDRRAGRIPGMQWIQTDQ
jgi:predicted nucleic-acid-binding protein